MKSWRKLILFAVAIWVFVFMIPKILNEFQVYRQFVETSHSKGIDNSALFYTEEPHALQSEQILKERLNLKK
jgi:hypothetical protein